MAGSRAPTIILTGGSRGIGLASLRILLRAPISANVISVSRTFPQELRELSNDHPDRLKILEGDVKDDQTNRGAVELAIQSFGSIDSLILNSAILRFDRLDQPDILDSFKSVFDVNFFSLVSILKYSIPHLRQSKGQVVFVSSGAAVGGIASWGSYNASKAAMNSLCRTLANEEPDITSLAIRPGVVATEMQKQLRLEGREKMDPANYKRFSAMAESSELIPAELPAQVIANLAIKADLKLSGDFLSWDSKELEPYRT